MNLHLGLVDQPAQRCAVGPPCSLKEGSTAPGPGLVASAPITDYWLSGVIPVAWPTWCGSPALFVQEGCGLLRDLGKHFLFPMAWKGQVLEELRPVWGGLCSCKELG